MNFRKNDIIAQFNYSSTGPSGRYDQLHWSVLTGKDASDIENCVVSAHEFMHNDLNNITTYGALLMTYTYLSREETSLKSSFIRVLNDLVEQCRTAHEVYATWQGIALYSRGAADELHLELLKDNEEYCKYYNYAAGLVRSIPDLYLQRQVVSGIIFACFQSRAIAEMAAANLSAFNPEVINPLEFPSARLEFIIKKFTPDYWLQVVVDFVEQQKESRWYDVLKAASAGRADETAFMEIPDSQSSEQLIEFTHARLAEELSKAGLDTLPYKSHLDFFRKILPAMDQLAPFSNSVNPIMINTQPDDIDRGVLQNFENETLQLSETPLYCFIDLPDEVSPEIKSKILNGAGELPHIFVVGRNLAFMRDQYIFPDERDRKWCEKGDENFTAIRYAFVRDGVRMIFYIPFSGPEELSAFLKYKPAHVAVLGSVAVTATYDDRWWSCWIEFFSKQCTTTCLLLDLSPLYYVENIFPKVEELLYEKVHIRMEEHLKVAMYFQLIQDGDTTAFLVAPCSEIHAQALVYYIQSRYSGYKKEIGLSENHLQNMPIILSHIFREEYKCYYRSQPG